MAEEIEMYLGIKNINICKRIIFLSILLFTFFNPIVGRYSDIDGFILLIIYIIELIIGFFIFILCTVFIIKNKKFNYYILTPFFLILFYICGNYYAKKDYKKIENIAYNITSSYFQGNDKINYWDNEILHEEDSSIEEIKINISNKIKIPKKMKIIKENNDILIYYNGLIYSVFIRRYRDIKYYDNK